MLTLPSISHDCPVKGGGLEELSLSEQDLAVQKWSILWRTIIMSALGQTIYPYCKHLRMLDLRDLGYLLDEDKFKQGKIMKNFFSGPMERFHLTVDAPVRQGSRTRPNRLDTKRIITAIGDLITEQSPLLEALTEPIPGGIFSSALLTWAPRMTHLRRLDLWDDSTLANEDVRNLLLSNCPHLDALCIYSASHDADKHLAAFISGMKSNTLTYFENISSCHLGLETAIALNNHGKSLSCLKLFLNDGETKALGCLQQCTSLTTLAINYSGPPDDLKASQNDVYLEIVDWLRNCTELRDISISNMISAPDMIMPILLNEENQLHKLQINSNEGLMYLVKDHEDFHQAIGQKSSLRELLLRADPEGLGRDHIDTLMTSICSLKDLRLLNLTRISDFFSDQHIKVFAHHLENLEDLYIGGYGITDGVWDSVARLKNLKSLTFSGLTSFTASGMLDFINQLGEGNRGMLMAVDNAEAESSLTPEEQELVKDAFSAKLDGRFQYQLWRGALDAFATALATWLT